MAQVGPDHYERSLAMKHAREMVSTGKVVKGMVYVAPEGIEDDSDLVEWLNSCVEFVESLPEKK